MKKHHYMYTYTCLLKKKKKWRGDPPIMSVHYHQFSCVGFANSHASCSLERCTSNYQSRARQEVSGTGVGTCKFMEKTTIPSTTLSFKTWNTSALLLNSLFLVNPFFWLTPVSPPYLFSHQKKTPFRIVRSHLRGSDVPVSVVHLTNVTFPLVNLAPSLLARLQSLNLFQIRTLSVYNIWLWLTDSSPWKDPPCY